jgi:hypothetical protein
MESAQIPEFLVGCSLRSITDSEIASSILSNVRNNRTGNLTGEASFLESENDDEEELSGIQEIFPSLRDAISNLFRFPILLRNNTKRDRYAEALPLAVLTHSMTTSIFLTCIINTHPFIQKAIIGNCW